MKVGLFADLHLHPYARFSSVSERGLNSWVERGLDVLERVYSECDSRSIKDVWCLGDLFHVGARLSTRMFNEVYRFFEAKQLDGFKTILIAGNHDQLARSGDDIALFSLKSVVDSIINRPVINQLCGRPILFLPYTEDYMLLQELLKQLQAMIVEDNQKLIVGHLAVEGARVGRHEYQPKEGCHLGLLEVADLVLLGHYHKRQILSKQVQYIGSVMATSFSDANEDKGFTILDTVDVTTEFVPIESIGFSVFEDNELQSSLIARGGYTGRIVRVDYSSELNESETRQLMLERGATAVIFNRQTVKQVEQRVTDPDTDLDSCIQEYVDRNDDGLDSNRLVSLGRELVKETSR